MTVMFRQNRESYIPRVVAKVKSLVLKWLVSKIDWVPLVNTACIEHANKMFQQT